MLIRHTFPIEAKTLMALADSKSAHKFVMERFFPNLGGLTENPRSALGVLFRVAMPNDPFGAPGVVSILVRSNLADPQDGDVIEEIPLAEASKVRVRLVAERRRTVDQSGRRRTQVTPVSDDEAHEWVAEMFARNGMEASNISVSRARTTGTPGGVRFASRDVAATIKVVDLEAANTALTGGMGRGKSYGLGLMLIEV